MCIWIFFENETPSSKKTKQHHLQRLHSIALSVLRNWKKTTIKTSNSKGLVNVRPFIFLSRRGNQKMNAGPLMGTTFIFEIMSSCFCQTASYCFTKLRAANSELQTPIIKSREAKSKLHNQGSNIRTHVDTRHGLSVSTSHLCIHSGFHQHLHHLIFIQYDDYIYGIDIC